VKAFDAPAALFQGEAYSLLKLQRARFVALRAVSLNSSGTYGGLAEAWPFQSNSTPSFHQPEKVVR
jgi:hypothetical protein